MSLPIMAERIILVLLIGLSAMPATAANRHLERWYQEAWCIDGEMEYRLPDRTRVDCLTATHAVEIDFASKWYQGITQALWYAANTGRRAGLLLIVERDSDTAYVARARWLARHYGLPIDIWTIRSGH